MHAPLQESTQNIGNFNRIEGMNYFNAFHSGWNSGFGGLFSSSIGSRGFSGFQGFSQGLFGGLASAWMGYVANRGWGFPGFGNQGCGHHVHHTHHTHHTHHSPGVVPKEGTWDSSKGGYVVGQSGQLNVNVQQGTADNDNLLQYRVGNGPWQDIASAKDVGHTTSIHAPPGSTVQFRIQTPQGEHFQAGTTNNVDGIDHAKVSKSQNGTVLGFEDLRGGGDKDFDDAVIEITDGRRKPLPSTPSAPAAPATRPTVGSGHWDEDKLGFVVGATGRMDLNNRSPQNPGDSFQYRVNGGEWQQLGDASFLEATPGALVQFQYTRDRGADALIVAGPEFTAKGTRATDTGVVLDIG